MFGILKLVYSFIFFCNALMILNDARFLSKIGLPLKQEAKSCLGPTRSKIVDLIKAVRTVVGLPLIGINLVCIIYEIFLG